MKTTKKVAAAEALAKGQDRFTWTCKHHGETEYHSRNRQCVTCKALDGKRRNQHRSADPKALADWNAYQRQYAAERRAQDPAYLGERRETLAATIWRKAFLPEGTMGNMPGWYSLEREAIRRRYADLPGGFEMDHAIPKLAKDAHGERKACGLHCWANLVETPVAVNRLKHTKFNPDLNRLQRPANRHPGGAFDPTPTEYERTLIRQNEEMGTPEAESLRTLWEELDAKAREHEQHVTALLERIGA